MANRYRGEVDLKAGGKTYTLRLGMDEVARIDDQTGKNLLSGTGFANLVQSPGALLEASVIAFSRHHPDMARDQVSELIDEVGLMPFIEALSTSYEALPGRPEAGASDPNPAAATGTSAGS
jgi:hypothetical protein